jgi:hypothetical protein
MALEKRGVHKDKFVTTPTGEHRPCGGLWILPTHPLGRLGQFLLSYETDRSFKF